MRAKTTIGQPEADLLTFCDTYCSVVVEQKRTERGAGATLATSLGIWNFNPAVGFEQLTRVARAVILTSGTARHRMCASTVFILCRNTVADGLIRI